VNQDVSGTRIYGKYSAVSTTTSGQPERTSRHKSSEVMAIIVCPTTLDPISHGHGSFKAFGTCVIADTRGVQLKAQAKRPARASLSFPAM
jgi:hypothetical protein